MANNWIKYLIFVLLLIYITLWSQINLFFSSLGSDKAPITLVEDSQISQLLEEKAGVNIKTIKISESDVLFGMMIGIPASPQLILSRSLYETFSGTELEYVLLHEAGHYNLWHSVKELLLGLVFCVCGIVLLSRLPNNFKSEWMALLLGLLFGILMIQYAKFSEIEADKYVLTRISDPNGMITATQKFREANVQRFDHMPLVSFMLERKNPYDNRIQMAKRVIEIRDSLKQ